MRKLFAALLASVALGLAGGAVADFISITIYR